MKLTTAVGIVAQDSRTEDPTRTSGMSTAQLVLEARGATDHEDVATLVEVGYMDAEQAAAYRAVLDADIDDVTDAADYGINPDNDEDADEDADADVREAGR